MTVITSAIDLLPRIRDHAVPGAAAPAGGQSGMKARSRATAACRRSPAGICGGSVDPGEVAQHVDLQLLLVELRADEIADADDADDPAAVLDGQVADAMGGHGAHCLVDPVLRAAGDGVGGHELA